MFARNNSKQFGGDAILAAAYLVNRMPSKVLDSKTPTGTLEQYLSHILCLGSHWLEKFFGCTAFIHIPSKDPSKLDHKAIKCIFLGYSPTQKGYKYYHQPSWKKSLLQWMLISLKNSYMNTKFILRGRNDNWKINLKLGGHLCQCQLGKMRK